MNVIFFGDSICFGEKVSPHRTWVTRTSADLAEEFGDDVLVINSAVNGDTTRLALERMPSAVQKYGVTVLIVQFGLNDCNVWQTDRVVPRVSPAAFEHNLYEIAARARSFGARRIVFNTNHPTLRTVELPTGVRYDDANRAYNKVIRRVAEQESDGVLADVEAAVLGSGVPLEQILLDDQLHLSPRGHALYHSFVGPIVTRAIRDLAG